MLEGEHEESKASHRSTLKRIAAEHETELVKVREEHGKKSALARQLVAEKDVILKAVTKEVDELRDEVESGSHTDRNILELAKAQAARDGLVARASTNRHEELTAVADALASQS